MGGISPTRDGLSRAVGTAALFLALLGVGVFAAVEEGRAQNYLEALPPRLDASSYAPGERGVLTLIFRNTLPATPILLVDVTVHFDWNATGEGLVVELGSAPPVLAPNQTVEYDLPVAVPSEALVGLHSYSFNATYSWEFLGLEIVESSSWGPFATLRVEEGGPSLLLWISLAAVVASAALVGVGLFVQRRKPSGLDLGRFFRSARAVSPPAELPIGTLRARAGAPVLLEPENVYLFEERKPRLAFEAVRSAQEEERRPTLIVAREPPERLEHVHGLRAEETLWLTYSHAPHAVEPTSISAITGRVYRFLEARARAVLLFEGLEYLITQNNFHTVLRFLSHIRDAALRRGASLVLVADPRVLSLRERALLERDARIVVPEDEPEEPSPGPPPPSTEGRREPVFR